jgi:site-specific DNA recombinase
MFEDYATGLYSLEEIRRRITNEGLRTKKNQKLAKSQVEKILTNPFYCGFMRKKTGELFPHIYPKLITQDLFYKCQDVKNGKSIKRHRRTLIPFTLRGMLTCKHCNCVYSPELKKEKYVYMRPTKSQGDCAYCFNIKEEIILDQIEDIIKSIHIPESILTQIKDRLKHLVSKQYTMQRGEIRKLEEQLQVSNERLKSMRLKFVDNIITAEEHALWSKEETNNKLSIEEKIQTLRLVDNDFEREVIQMLELANRSHELFKSSDVDQKRQIISLLLPNLFLDGENLDYTLIKPFDNMVNLANRPNWLPGRDSNPRPID